MSLIPCWMLVFPLAHIRCSLDERVTLQTQCNWFLQILITQPPLGLGRRLQRLPGLELAGEFLHQLAPARSALCQQWW